MRKKQKRLNGRQAFTLVEMMIVVAIIAILVGGVFRLLSVAGEKNKEAVTITHLERLQNALSGYYAKYGSYPPVQQYEYPDPEKRRNADDRSSIDDVTFSDASANRAAHSQSIAYEFPPIKNMDDYIDLINQNKVRSAGIALGGSRVTESSWYNQPLFKFGLLSYLLPRAHIAWGNETDERYEKLFASPQWSQENFSSSSGQSVEERVRKMFEGQKVIEERTVAQWLPNFEKCILHGTTVMGINLAGPWDALGESKETQAAIDEENERRNWFPHYKDVNGTPFAVERMTMVDGWNRELYYYSAPPYQSYRVWSAGRDGRTFPPWIPLDAKNDYKKAAEWIEDDIVRFDH